MIIVVRTVYGIEANLVSYQFKRLDYSLGSILPTVKLRKSWKMWSKSVFLQLLEVLEFVAQQQLTDIAYSRFVSLYYVYHKDMKKQLRARKPCAVPVCSQNWMNDQLHLRKFVFSFFCIDLHSEGLNEGFPFPLPPPPPAIPSGWHGTIYT